MSVAPPDSNPKTIHGIAKPSVAAVPPIAFFKIGEAMADGERKYGRFNWRAHNITASVYYNAALRHLMAWHDGENIAADSGVDHLAHAAACLAVLMDATDFGSLNDDRGQAGSLPEYLADHTVKTTSAAVVPLWRCVDDLGVPLALGATYTGVVQRCAPRDDLLHVDADDSGKPGSYFLHRFERVTP